ncbi:acyl-CoA dehydrogenase family protein [Kutzneria albida]|uniref:Putative acyl-CoA dehydrogenase n=1 Tax=Kutzneria albida DSM 43870 TaxID=1449976 RepID=W5W558_9PSEU|nr:acyl-CoA dehydrogenase family protein [Kutzneria albida]AHH95596.1 putative acyl-CoA dehydrogenase [Kutzneria albida DSM 43870]
MSELLYSEVENDLRASVRDLLSDRSPWTAVLARTETDQPYDLALWRTLATELGLAGLLVPEELGGAGASAREVAVVLEELGRAVAPVPFLGSAVLATSALLAAGDAELLPELAAGNRTATLGVTYTTAPNAVFPASVHVHNGRLTGRIGSVVDLDVAEFVVVPAVGAAGPELHVIEVSSARVTPVVPLDLTRRISHLELDGVSGRLLATGDAAEQALRSALTTGAGLLAAEQLGLAQWCLDSTVDYAKTRYQFGRQIGSFQAIKHRLADLWAATSSALATSRAAASALATGEDVGVSVAVAAAYCSDVAVLAAEEALQLHGGIGMTWEHPVHLYLGRAKSSQLALGSPERHRAALATLIDLPA